MEPDIFRQRMEAFVTAIRLLFNTIFSRIGNMASLATTAKTSLVAAINELFRRTAHINVRDFGAKYDGTDDSVALTSAINSMFATNGGVLKITGNLKITTPIVISPPAGNFVGKIIIEGGGTIDLTGIAANTTALTFQMGAATIWRNLLIRNLFIQGGVNVIKFDGGPGGKFMYHFAIRDVEVNGCSGTALWMKGNFFESQFQNINLGTSSTTQPCILLDASDLSGGGALGSIDFIACNASGGKNNLASVGAVTDINIYGGTFLSSREEPIFLGGGTGGFCYKASVIALHVEAGWLSATSLATGGAAVRIVGTGTVQDVIVYSNSALGSYIRYVAQYFLSGYGAGKVDNCQISDQTGQKLAFLGGTGGQTVTLIGNDTSYDWDYSPIIIHQISNKGIISPCIRQTNNSIAYAASIAPDLRVGHTISVGALTGNITINNPTPIDALGHSPGHKLVFILTQDGTGGRVVTWGSEYVVLGTTVNLTANSTSVIELTYGSNKWRQENTPKPTFISVTDLGVYPGLASNQGPAIQSAINFARTNGYSEVHFPKGVYISNVKISTYRDIRLVGFGATLKFSLSDGLDIEYANGINEKVVVGLSIEGGVVSTAQYPAVNEWTNATGIRFKCPFVNLENAGVFGFNKGLDFESQSYIISLVDCQIQKNNIGVFFDASINGRTNLGENILFRGGVVGNNREGISNKLGMLNFQGTSIDYNRIHISKNETKISGYSSGALFISGCHIESSEDRAGMIVNDGAMHIANTQLWFNSEANPMFVNNDELVMSGNHHHVPTTAYYLVGGNAPKFTAGTGINASNITYIHPDLSGIPNSNFAVALSADWKTDAGTGTAATTTTKTFWGSPTLMQTSAEFVSAITYSPYIPVRGRLMKLQVRMNSTNQTQGNFISIAQYDALGVLITTTDQFIGLDTTDVFNLILRNEFRLEQGCQLIRVKFTGSPNRSTYWAIPYLNFQ